MMKKSINIGIIGLGTVGRGVIQLLQRNRSAIEPRIAAQLKLRAVCDRRKSRCPKELLDIFYPNWQKVVNDPEIDIVIELIGGLEPARTIILTALKNKKPVVTANKAVLANHWSEIFHTARQFHSLVYFEASVGGGIPVIQAINEGLAGNCFSRIVGILNGTTNYILTQMAKKRLDFRTALHWAQKKGFAEANPKTDIAGIDTANKLAILSSLAWNIWIKPQKISVVGIEGITLMDVIFADEEFGYVPKLLGLSQVMSEGLLLVVRPFLVSKDHPFSKVDNEFNAIMIKGNAVDEVMLVGRGAGAMPAASAVVSDIIFLARQINSGLAGNLPYVSPDHKKHLRIVPSQKLVAPFYLRFMTVDRPGVLSTISGYLARSNVSIAGVYQKAPLDIRRRAVPIVILTHPAKEGNLRRALERIEKLPISRTRPVFLPIIKF